MIKNSIIELKTFLHGYRTFSFPVMEVKNNWIPSRVPNYENDKLVSKFGVVKTIFCKEFLKIWDWMKNNKVMDDFMLDNRILKAAPKKKTSYLRKRIRFLSADKQIKKVTGLVRCSACGKVKRNTFICMECFQEIKSFLTKKKRQLGLLLNHDNSTKKMDAIDKRIIYPEKYLSDEDRKLKSKDWIPVREKSMFYEKDVIKKIRNF